MFIGRAELLKGARTVKAISGELGISDVDSDVIKWVPWDVFCAYLFLVALWVILFVVLSAPNPAN